LMQEDTKIFGPISHISVYTFVVVCVLRALRGDEQTFR
jgi:hypothetical protein